MALTIVTTPQREHWGTKDPVTGSFYDYPGKAEGCLKAAKDFIDYTLSLPSNDPFGRLGSRGAHPASLVSISASGDMLDEAERVAASVHSNAYLHQLERASSLIARESAVKSSREPKEFGIEAMVSPETYLASLDSVAAVIKGCEILKRDFGSTVHVTTRTPGHHATRDQAIGFCYLNQAAIIARLAADAGEQVCVLDLDHHDGNGTADILKDEPHIEFIDICGRTQFDQASQTYQGLVYDKETKNWIRNVGEFPYQNNCPEWGLEAIPAISAKNITRLEFWDKHYDEVKDRPFDKGALPEIIATRFLKEALPVFEKKNPSLIVVSLGVDSMQGDPIGGLGYLPGHYYLILRGLRERFPQAKIMSVMEGGYHQLGWETGIPAALAGLHADLGSTEGMPAFTKRYIGAFFDTAYREAIINGDSQACKELMKTFPVFKHHPAVAISVDAITRRARDR